MIDHDFDHPLNEVHKLEAARLAATMPACPHCHAEHAPLPMTGTAWGVETFHEASCPNHEDNQPAAEWGGDDDAS